MHRPATKPNELEQFLVERVNARDIDGIVALYEKGATVDTGNVEPLTGHEEIREFFVKFLADRPRLTTSDQSDALVSGDLALTLSRHSNGDISTEVARRQPDGTWLWVLDRFSI